MKRLKQDLIEKLRNGEITMEDFIRFNEFRRGEEVEEFKWGEEVDINNGNGWESAVYVARTPLSLATNKGRARYIVIANSKGYNELSFALKCRKPKEEINITVKLNGKKINPSEISEETWNNLRKGK